jgi:hypothetical protein
LTSKPTARESKVAILTGWLVNSLIEIANRQAARR